MGDKRSNPDQLGIEHDAEEQMQAKEPMPEPEVPGVRGPMSSSGEREQPPASDVETWGSEGGAGVYQGAPNISEARAPRRGALGRTWARAK